MPNANGMDVKEYIRDKLSQLAREHDMPNSRLGEIIGRDSSYFGGLIRDKSAPKYEALKELCDYFEITLSDFFKDYPNTPNDNVIMEQRILNKIKILLKGVDLKEFYNLIDTLSPEELSGLLKYLKRYGNRMKNV